MYVLSHDCDDVDAVMDRHALHGVWLHVCVVSRL